MESTKEFQEETRRYFDRVAEDYDASYDGRFVRCMYREVVRRAVSLPGDRVLDLGCGNGNLIRMLREVKQASCWGADLSSQMIREAGKNLGDKVNLTVADAAALPYGDGQFDIVICNASFHHYTEPERAVEEIRRVLKTGGTLILGDPTIPGRLGPEAFEPGGSQAGFRGFQNLWQNGNYLAVRSAGVPGSQLETDQFPVVCVRGGKS